MEHHFNTDIAAKYGIEEAILIHNIFFWIQKNAANDRAFHEDRYWTYLSQEAMGKLFGYIDARKIRRALKHIFDEGLTVTGNFNDDKFNKTNWYSFTDKALEYLASVGYKTDKLAKVEVSEETAENPSTDTSARIGQNGHIDEDKMAASIGPNWPHRIGQNEPINNNILKEDTKEDTKERNNKERNDETADPAEQNFITFMHDNFPRVCGMRESLTYKQYKNIRDRLGYTYNQIREVLMAMENKPQLQTKYISANLTLQNWLRIRKNDNNNNNGTSTL